MAGDIPIEKKFHVLTQIQRKSHFEWLAAAMHFVKEGTAELDVVKKYWEIVGVDTAAAYLDHLDPDKPLPRQIAECYVFSSRSMGEDAEFVEGDGDHEAYARHNGCPWHEWHMRHDKLEQDLPGCNMWIKSFLDVINEKLGTRIRFETKEALPEGGSVCLRRFWIES